MPHTAQLRADVFERAAPPRLARSPPRRARRQQRPRRRDLAGRLSDSARPTAPPRAAPPPLAPHQAHPAAERREVHQHHRPLTVGPQHTATAPTRRPRRPATHMHPQRPAALVADTEHLHITQSHQQLTHARRGRTPQGSSSHSAVFSTPILGDPSRSTADPHAPHSDLKREEPENIVERYEDNQPWLRDVWNHTNKVVFVYQARERHGTATYYGNRLDEGDSLPRSTAIAITAHPTQLLGADESTLVHELAHVYTKSNRVVADPARIAAGHLYFSEITQGGECGSHELYAETAEILIFSRHIPQNNWGTCPETPEWVTDEAIEVVRQAFSGQMPQWFYDTFYDSAGNRDYRAIWAAVGRMTDGQSQLAVINQLRYSFGGYCSEADVWEEFRSTRGDLGPDQPWVDGGCPESSG